MSSIDNSTNSNRQSQNGQQNPEIQPNSTSAMQAEDMDGQWFEEAGPDGDGEDCTDSSSSKIKPDYFDRRISTQRVYGDHTIGREFPSETSKVVDQTVKSLTASSTLERERLHTDGGSTSKPVIAENVDDVIAILNKSEFLSELKSIPSPGSKESQNYGFRHPLETEESPEKCFGQSSGRDNGYSNGRPATLPEKLAELVLAMQMNVGEIAKNAADEWDNDDDNGYIIIPLSEEEYDELEVVSMLFNVYQTCLNLF